MNKPKTKLSKSLRAFPLCLLSIAIQNQVLAQEQQEKEGEQESASTLNVDFKISSPIEEVLTLGRLQGSAHELVLERMESEDVVDILSSEQMTRIGDSNVAAALVRVPGLTLIDGKFVYVRGLGERYSSTQLNGATVPSPDLTRNVLPLDIFPASIVDSVKIQKTFSADMPATFGGGNINIRTKGIPDGPVLSVEVSGGSNSESADLLTYSGGGDDDLGTDDGTRALSEGISSGLHTYRTSLDSPEGDISPVAIQATYARSGSEISDAEAEAINAALATGINRNLDVSEESESLNDFGASLALGNAFDIGGLWQAGFLADLGYDRSTRTDDSILRAYEDPEDEFQEQTRTTQNVSITGALNFGVLWGDDHIIEAKNLYLRNTDDTVSVSNIYNQTIGFSSGQGFRDYSYRYEEREMEIYQLEGSHRLGYDTKELLGLGDSFFDDLSLDWFYSDATVNTEIPSETSIQGFITRDVDTNEITSSRLLRGQRMFQTRYTDLVDIGESSGVEFTLPVTAGDFDLELSAGSKSDRKSRTYDQLDLAIGTTSSAVDSTLSSPVSEALSDENILNPDFDYRLTYQSGLSRSYLAAQTIDALFGEFDIFWKEKIRLAAGARYEEYASFSSPWQPYRVQGSQLQCDLTSATETDLPDCIYYEDDVYGAMSLTYVAPGFLAEDFQLRFGISETTVRPDIREISASSFQDPLNNNLIVNGNPDVVPSDVTNIDLRAEWAASSGDNLSISLFYKDLVNPIEYFEEPGAENSSSASIQNAESGQVQGIEVEFMKRMDFLGSFASQFYTQGNFTVGESEIVVGDAIDVAVTNRTRSMQGASEYVINLQFGFDSDDGKHSATLAFNEFGERIYAAGIGGEPDANEQPFSALDFSYFYYPTEEVTVKFTAKNILGEDKIITKGNLDWYEETVGTSFGLSLKYSY